MRSEFTSKLIQRMDDIEGVTLAVAPSVKSSFGQWSNDAGAVVRFLDGSWVAINVAAAEELLNDPGFRRSDRRVSLNTTGKSLQG